MTTELVVLSHTAPDRIAIVTALLAAGPALHLAQETSGGPITLLNDEGEALVSIQTPTLVQISGEATRLLGVAPEPALPYWWIDIQAGSESPRAAAVANRFAGALAETVGGTTWSNQRRPADEEEAGRSGSVG
jgi:hypothetical protein